VGISEKRNQKVLTIFKRGCTKADRGTRTLLYPDPRGTKLHPRKNSTDLFNAGRGNPPVGDIRHKHGPLELLEAGIICARKKNPFLIQRGERKTRHQRGKGKSCRERNRILKRRERGKPGKKESGLLFRKRKKKISPRFQEGRREWTRKPRPRSLLK